MRSVENEKCGKCGEWKMNSVENVEWKWGVWKMSVEIEECGKWECCKCGVWKIRSVVNAECGK